MNTIKTQGCQYFFSFLTKIVQKLELPNKLIFKTRENEHTCIRAVLPKRAIRSLFLGSVLTMDISPVYFEYIRAVPKVRNGRTFNKDIRCLIKQ
jgi:hypothetical protein